MSDDEDTIRDKARKMSSSAMADSAIDDPSAALHELQSIAERFEKLESSLPETAGEMTLEDLDELIGELFEASETLDRVANRAAVALDNLQSVDDS